MSKIHERWLSDKTCERCSNRAIKGYRFCDLHCSQVRREMVESGYLSTWIPWVVEGLNNESV
jgi:hypothetical protein